MRREDFLKNPEFLAKIIPSRTVRENLGGWQPTDFELAAIIANTTLPLEEKEDYLKVIAAGSADEKLCGQIHSYIRHRQRAFDLVAENEGAYLYELGGSGERYGFFQDFRQAEETGRGLGKPFEIDKYPLGRLEKEQVTGALNPFLAGQAPGEEKLIRGEGRLCPVGSICYNPEGRATDWWLAPDADRALTPGEVVRWDYDPALFPNAFVALPNPFRKGDVVRVVAERKKTEAHGVVLTSQEEWQTLCAQVKVGRYADYSEAALVVDLLDDQGSFFHDHISPLELERVEPEDQAARYYLLAGRSLILGKGSLEAFCVMGKQYRRVRQASAEVTEYYLQGGKP